MKKFRVGDVVHVGEDGSLRVRWRSADAAEHLFEIVKEES